MAMYDSFALLAYESAYRPEPSGSTAMRCAMRRACKASSTACKVVIRALRRAKQ